MLGLAAATAATGVAWSALGVRPAFAATGATPSGAAFVPYVGTRFRVLAADGSVTVLKLVAANQLPVRTQAKTTPSGDVYSLIFSAVSGPALPSLTQTVTHPDLGRFLLFLGPVVSKQGPRYEAVINHQSAAA
jgi:hypothetical protein